MHFCSLLHSQARSCARSCAALVIKLHTCCACPPVFKHLARLPQLHTFAQLLRPAGCLVINSGDLIRFYTNGLWKSAMHRVVTTSTAPRFSTAYFTYPDMDAVIKPLDRWGPGLSHQVLSQRSAMGGMHRVECRRYMMECCPICAAVLETHMHAGNRVQAGHTGTTASQFSVAAAGTLRHAPAARCRFVSAERPSSFPPTRVSDYFHFKIEESCDKMNNQGVAAAAGAEAGKQ